ncbi:MAG: ABC transporter permease [Actinobacteria bacterium]|jgi:simple sugar transport system permease protein|nr:ABC transporter permease [Actinomycetota bacterium]NDE83408.1 ABC transporter permease [Actinomycetota bacterium]
MKEKTKSFFKSPARITILIAIVFFIIALVENITGAVDISSPGTSGATLRFAIPLLMAGLGGLWAERAGVINIGLEGMMIVGTWTAAWFGYLHGPWIGLLAAAIFGLLSGLFHAILTVKIGIDQAVSGLAINLIAAGAARYLSGIFFPPVGGDRTVSPPVETLPTFTVPVVAPFFQSIDEKNIFLISNISGLIYGITTDLSVVTVGLLLFVPLTSWILWRSKFGLRMRFSGENPMAAESLGINVYMTRYIAISVSGMMASLGGAYLALVASSVYREGQTAGRGFIGLATVIFGNWRPSGVFAGSILFGFTDALRVRQSESVMAMIMAAGILAGLLSLYFALARKWKPAGVSGGIALFALWMNLRVTNIPQEFITAFPNLATLIVLTFLAQRLTPPAMAGMPYRRGSE